MVDETILARVERWLREDRDADYYGGPRSNPTHLNRAEMEAVAAALSENPLQETQRLLRPPLPEGVRAFRNALNERRHQFRQSNGRWQACGGPGRCRECNREKIVLPEWIERENRP